MHKIEYIKPGFSIEVMEFNDVIMASEEPTPPPVETQIATSAFEVGGGKETDMDWF